MFTSSRVVVCTGSPTTLDWSVWSNFIWFKDFPLNRHQNKTATKKKVADDEFDFDEDFKNTLKSYVHHLMPKNTNYTTLLNFNLDNYTFSNIDIVLISSIPGRARDKEIDKHGHRKVASIIKTFMSKSPEAGGGDGQYTMTYQTTSLANLNENFIKEALSSFFPNFIDLDQLRAEKRYQKILTQSREELLGRVRIIYPSKKYIENSIEGPQYSGCLAINSDCYFNNSFPKEVFYHFQNPGNYIHHEGLIPHSNLFVVTSKGEEINDETYIYFGSHCFTSSAWGRYEKDYNQFAINSYELGILIPPGRGNFIYQLTLMNKEQKQGRLMSSISFPLNFLQKPMIKVMFHGFRKCIIRVVKLLQHISIPLSW